MVVIVADFVSELHRHLARPGCRLGQTDRVLNVVAAAVAKDFRSGNAPFGTMVQTLVNATRNNTAMARKSSHGIRSSDARLARALAFFLHSEAKTLWEVFGECIPEHVGQDWQSSRESLVQDLVDSGDLYEGIDSNGCRAFGWTEAGHGRLAGPYPVGPAETRLSREDFADLFASG